jgi:uncharacterized protein YprB with RNaseH-like and TPR domain
MLESTFVFLKGIGPYSERRLWEHGIDSWRAFLREPSPPGISPQRKPLYDLEVSAAIDHLEAGNSRFFAACLKSRDHWRLFDTFRSRALFLDIETSGEPAGCGHATVIGLCANGRMTSLVYGETLTEERLNEAFAQADLLVTFFGSVFDVPFLRAAFPGLDIRLPHFDLCFAARRVGLHGGLKRIEAELSISRDTDLDGLDGWDAVRLWNEWRRGRQSSLDLLLRYNAADTRNLEPLAERLYGRLVERYGPPAPHYRSAAHPG